MKTRVALIAAALLASAVALAGPHEGGHPGPDMDRMATLLDLNDSQKAEVQKIFNEQHEKLDAKHQELKAAGTKPTREEREKFHEEMKQEMTTKLQGVLTPEQMKKFDALMDHPRGPHGQSW
ncbi:MAG TPA: Spy/CpxP family protein refolding chaperone [Steroidobacteraceae bacterium]|nr:Spy/CpxP family protein refolding chaperone [Steroidobacteraceae bacterium]